MTTTPTAWACLRCRHHWHQTGTPQCPECGPRGIVTTESQYHAPTTDLAPEPTPHPTDVAADVRALKTAVADIWRVLTDPTMAEVHAARLDARRGTDEIEDYANNGEDTTP